MAPRAGEFHGEAGVLPCLGEVNLLGKVIADVKFEFAAQVQLAIGEHQVGRSRIYMHICSATGKEARGKGG